MLGSVHNPESIAHWFVITEPLRNNDPIAVYRYTQSRGIPFPIRSALPPEREKNPLTPKNATGKRVEVSDGIVVTTLDLVWQLTRYGKQQAATHVMAEILDPEVVMIRSTGEVFHASMTTEAELADMYANLREAHS